MLYRKGKERPRAVVNNERKEIRTICTSYVGAVDVAMILRAARAFLPITLALLQVCAVSSMAVLAYLVVWLAPLAPTTPLLGHIAASVLGRTSSFLFGRRSKTEIKRTNAIAIASASASMGVRAGAVATVHSNETRNHHNNGTQSILLPKLHNGIQLTPLKMGQLQHQYQQQPQHVLFSPSTSAIPQLLQQRAGSCGATTQSEMDSNAKATNTTHNNSLSPPASSLDPPRSSSVLLGSLKLQPTLSFGSGLSSVNVWSTATPVGMLPSLVSTAAGILPSGAAAAATNSGSPNAA